MWAAVCGVSGVARVALGAGLPAHAPAGTGQQALSVYVANGDVVAATCASAPCSAGAIALGVPASLRSKPVSADVVALGAGRRAVVLAVSDGKQTFQAVVAAPLGAGAPKVLFAGLVGLLSGQPGTLTGPMVQVSEAEPDGTRHVLVGVQHEGQSLCGRPTMFAPRILHPQDMELHGAKLQRLSLAERDKARHVTATRIADDEPSHAARSVLSALVSSNDAKSKISPQALTDGDPETSWSEDVSGDGKGEFVVMRAPPELPISGLELVVRPKLATVADGASPERLFIAGARDIVEVTLPEDAWKSPGARYRISLDPPLQGSCLALVLDSAFDRSKAAKVSVAELSVVPQLEATALPALAAQLAGGGQRAEAAKALLVAGGEPAFAVVAKAFDGLDEGGKRVALDVLDQAPCDISAPVYVAALIGKIDAQLRHAQSRLARCGAAGGEALAQALAKIDKTDKKLMPLLVTQLTLTDPARAVTTFLPLMDEKLVVRRRLLRTALGQVARTEAANKAVRSALADPATPPVALLDLLRALGDTAPRYQPEAGQALMRLSQSAPEFRARYLLLGPTSLLSGVSSEADAAFRKSLASDPDPHVRAAALALVRDPKRFQNELLKALADGDVRVREASVHALAAREATFAGPALSERLEQDQWPLVRAAAADALAHYPAGAALDRPLTKALSDDSALVRARSIRALGERRAAGVAQRIRDRLVDAEEWPEVRAEAARALGALCDRDSGDELAAFAKKLADPMASPDAQLIATAAVMSLGRLASPDLPQQLAPLVGKKAPPQARRAAAMALATQPTCYAQPKR
jgi:hypothetical protein